MLFEPFEEQFDLPAALIQLGDGQGGHGEVVRQKNQRLAGDGIAIADAAERHGIIVLGLEVGQHDRLVKAQPGGFIHRLRVAADKAEVFSGAGDKKGGRQMQAIEPGEVEIAAIHDVERPRLPRQLVEEVHVVNLARSDNDDGGKVTLEREQRVELDGGFVAAELGLGNSERHRSIVVESSA